MRDRQGRTTHARAVTPCALAALVLSAGGGASGAAGAAASAWCGTDPAPLARPAHGSLRPDVGTPAATAPTTLAPPIAGRGDPGRGRAPGPANLIERLHGARLDGGHGERTRCLGRGGERRSITFLFDLEQLERVETLDGRTLLTAFESRHAPVASARDDRRVGDTLVAEVIDLPPVADWRAGDDATSLHARRRFRRSGATSASCAFARGATLEGPASSVGASGCSVSVEIVTTARAAPRAIEIEQVLYVGGRRSERVVWRLDS